MKGRENIACSYAADALVVFLYAQVLSHEKHKAPKKTDNIDHSMEHLTHRKTEFLAHKTGKNDRCKTEVHQKKKSL